MKPCRNKCVQDVSSEFSKMQNTACDPFGQNAWSGGAALITPGGNRGESHFGKALPTSLLVQALAWLIPEREL